MLEPNSYLVHEDTEFSSPSKTLTIWATKAFITHPLIWTWGFLLIKWKRKGKGEKKERRPFNLQTHHFHMSIYEQKDTMLKLNFKNSIPASLWNSQRIQHQLSYRSKTVKCKESGQAFNWNPILPQYPKVQARVKLYKQNEWGKTFILNIL